MGVAFISVRHLERDERGKGALMHRDEIRIVIEGETDAHLKLAALSIGDATDLKLETGAWRNDGGQHVNRWRLQPVAGQIRRENLLWVL